MALMKWNFVWILMMSFSFLQGQNAFVKGRTLDTFSRPMEQVNISALNTNDSSILQTQLYQSIYIFENRTTWS